MSALAGIMKGMRVPQWSKNFFVLAPVLFGGKAGELEAVYRSLTAFCCFCMMASGLYLFNDVLDKEADQLHPRKKNRPVAAGQLGARPALIAAGVLVALSWSLTSFLDESFVGPAACYFVLTVAYNIWLKRVLLVDAIAIAAGFALRVVGGAAAVDVVPSHWLILCAFLLALYLAFDKRRLERVWLGEASVAHRIALRGCSVDYLERAKLFLLCSTFMGYVLYTLSPETVERLGTDLLVYGSVFVLYGLLRYMALTEGSLADSDPVVLIMKDVPLLSAVAGWVIYSGLVIYRESLGF